eukprot:1747810-Prymnesium_polylepis.2
MPMSGGTIFRCCAGTARRMPPSLQPADRSRTSRAGRPHAGPHSSWRLTQAHAGTRRHTQAHARTRRHTLSPGVWNVWPRPAASGRRLAG